MISCRTLPRVRELKLIARARVSDERGRTLPRVRELKRASHEVAYATSLSRTLPRVRELKLGEVGRIDFVVLVAPFPGCVN